MNCNNCPKRLCKNFILSQSVTFDGTNLVVNLPARIMAMVVIIVSL